MGGGEELTEGILQAEMGLVKHRRSLLGHQIDVYDLQWPNQRATQQESGEKIEMFRYNSHLSSLIRILPLFPVMPSSYSMMT